MKFEITKQDKINKIIEMITVEATDGGQVSSPRYRKLDNEKLASFMVDLIENQYHPESNLACSQCGALKEYKAMQGHNANCECFCHRK